MKVDMVGWELRYAEQGDYDYSTPIFFNHLYTQQKYQYFTTKR
jgi:hypothetical protein